MAVRRLLLFIAILYVIWRVLNALGRRLERKSAGADTFSRFSAAGKRRDRPAERLVPCSRCGTLVPESRLVRDAKGRPVCSSDCLGAGGEHRGS